jgi:hypothetical protein
LTNSGELIAFIASYIFGQIINRGINWRLIPWLMQNGHQDKVTLAGWLVTLSVMLVVLVSFLMARRLLGAGVTDTGADS